MKLLLTWLRAKEWGWPGIIILPAILISGCSNKKTLEQEHQYDLANAAGDALAVVDYFPAPDVSGVPKNIQPYFFFNRALTSADALQIALANTLGTHFMFAESLDFDSAGVVYVPDSSVTASDYPYILDLYEENGSSLVGYSEFETTFPEGLMFNMSTELECTQFGGSWVQARILNSYFEPGVYPLWIMVAENLNKDSELPATFRLLMGPGYIRSNGNYRIYRSIGFVSIFNDVTADREGNFSAALDGEFMPLDTPERVVLTYMNDVRISGRFDLTYTPARIHDFRISGIFPTRSLLMLADESESYESAVHAVELDVDLNGNGINDSATFKAESFPMEILPEQWEP